ncbi:gas vesicle protein [Streptomyces yangpuensis]|uniref:gas vesicle protein n=1 Tax=Streptomyces yangpuensis TaxID=1648182 RepID=UPI0006293D79|nr:gas vesicle protein [Streptomyces yangpuensis]
MSLAEYDEPLPGRQVALVDLLDRLLSGGVVVVGDIVLSIADIDLVRISLRALIVSVSSETSPGTVQDEQDEDAQEGNGRDR